MTSWTMLALGLGLLAGASCSRIRPAPGGTRYWVRRPQGDAFALLFLPGAGWFLAWAAVAVLARPSVGPGWQALVLLVALPGALMAVAAPFGAPVPRPLKPAWFREVDDVRVAAVRRRRAERRSRRRVARGGQPPSAASAAVAVRSLVPLDVRRRVRGAIDRVPEHHEVGLVASGTPRRPVVVRPARWWSGEPAVLEDVHPGITVVRDGDGWTAALPGSVAMGGGFPWTADEHTALTQLGWSVLDPGDHLSPVYLLRSGPDPIRLVETVAATLHDVAGCRLADDITVRAPVGLRG